MTTVEHILAQAPSRYLVDITSADRHIHVTQAWDALVAWNAQHLPEPPLYRHGAQLVRVMRDEEHVKLEPYSRASLMELLSEVCVFQRETTRGLQRVPVPAYVAEWLLARPADKLPAASQIARVTDVPVFGRDGTVLVEPGYHSAARTFYAPAPGLERIGAIGGWESDLAPFSQRELDVTEAREVILDLFADFPFADDASRAHAICLLLEPFVRELIGDEPTPLTGVMATQPGTGKTLCVTAALGVGCGRVAASSYTPDEDELRKRITSALVQGDPVIFFDNVKHKMDSGVLSLGLTAPRWGDRILGHTKMADVPIRNVWVMTANNPSVSEELTRRIVPIFLVSPDGVDPKLRTDFRHSHLMEWVEENRGALVSAALTLVANHLHGATPYSDDNGEIVWLRTRVPQFLASYKRWAMIMGGILKDAGIPGFLANLGELQGTIAMDIEERGSFMAALHALSPNAATTQEWVSMVTGEEGDGVWPVPGNLTAPIELPLELHDPSGRKLNAHKLGIWFRDQRGAVIDGYKVVKAGSRPTRWQIEKVGY
jgi:putative DNA primase/helicase